VVHLAQIGSEARGQRFEDVNVAGTRAVVAAARQAGVGRVVFLSGLGVARYGLAPRCTNRYFLSKLRAESEVLGSGLAVVVFRPSYIVGPGDGLITRLLRSLAQGAVEWPGDGGYRLQPIAVRDVAALVLEAARAGVPGAGRTPHRVFDLVGPEALPYRDFVARLARAAGAQGRPARFDVRTVTIDEAERQAREGGYQGWSPEDLDCLLCDEVSDPRPLEALLGRFLTPLDEALASAVVSGTES
jgi:nucleoside-diphosphate-sugar epimerase